MRPASRPRLSWSPPSWGLMSSRVWSAKDMGRAPNLSWSANTLELAAVKLPVMLALPEHRDAWATGAEITWLSSTMPNWLRGLGSDTMREVTSQKDLVPAALKSSRTSHWPVAPPWLCCWPEVAFEISVPSTSAGPRMYLTGRSLSQVTMGLAGSSTMASTLLGLAQSSVASAFSSSGVTHARSLAFLGLAVVVDEAVVGLAVGAGVVAAVSAGGKPDLGAVVAVPVAAGLLVAGAVVLPVTVPVDVGTGVGAVPASTRTARIRSCDDFCSEAMVALSGLPGSETTMLLPWVVTSASATPDPSTRARMMSTAFWTWPGLIAWLPTTLGSRISCVPPCRSSPSFGVR